jgi:ribonuclease VapC
MFVDASAIVAILAGEVDSDLLSERLGLAVAVHTSPIAVYEAVLGLARATCLSIDEAQTAVDRFLEQTAARILPVTTEIGRAAIGAFEQFGRGRHPAQLNMGDCFAYACARSLDAPLLFKGDDFSRTDIAAA